MGKRQFKLDFSLFSEYVDTAVIELDDAVIDVVDDAWRAMFYNLHTPERIAEHVGLTLLSTMGSFPCLTAGQINQMKTHALLSDPI